MRCRLLAILALALAACGGDESSEFERSAEGNRTSDEQVYIAQMQERIAAKLRDPGEAEFRNARVYHSIAPMVCGEVNAMNGFGGRSRYQRFISGGSIQVLEEEMAPGEMAKTWEQACR